MRERLALATPDVVMLCADIEPAYGRFSQNASFFYFTGCTEPGAVLLMYGDGRDVLLVPRYDGMRQRWVANEIVPTETDPALFGVDEVCYLGDRVRGYSLPPLSEQHAYRELVARIIALKKTTGRLFVGALPAVYSLVYDQRLAHDLLEQAAFDRTRVFDAHPVIAQLRRCKDAEEIAAIRSAIAVTKDAQAAAAELMRAGVKECEIQAALEAVFVRAGCLVPAFASIVATGKNATILHYVSHTATLQAGELVVVDIGASWNGYAADITRTYAVDGVMSIRQREIYQLVAQTQAFVASQVAPGMWLRNPQQPTKSLQHITEQYLSDHGFAKAMPHGIGHFMGLQVHDVGDTSEPLAPGDVITIEPGIYLPKEGIGVRIEDDYLVTAQGVQCLSSQIPKL